MLPVVHCDLGPVSGVVCCEAGGKLRPPVTCTVYSEEQAALYCSVLYSRGCEDTVLALVTSALVSGDRRHCADAEVEDMGRLT